MASRQQSCSRERAEDNAGQHGPKPSRQASETRTGRRLPDVGDERRHDQERRGFSRRHHEAEQAHGDGRQPEPDHPLHEAGQEEGEGCDDEWERIDRRHCAWDYETRLAIFAGLRKNFRRANVRRKMGRTEANRAQSLIPLGAVSDHALQLPGACARWEEPCRKSHSSGSATWASPWPPIWSRRAMGSQASTLSRRRRRRPPHPASQLRPAPAKPSPKPTRLSPCFPRASTFSRLMRIFCPRRRRARS